MRLGHEQKGGATGIKQHPFFRGVDFATLRQSKAPFVPELKSITDTSHFPTDEIADISKNLMDTKISTVSDTFAQKKDLAFVGYTFKKFDYLTKKNAL